jgi:phage terminase large subunit-like protein
MKKTTSTRSSGRSRGKPAPPSAPRRWKVAARRSPVTRYAERVVEGKILTNRWVRLACERHLRDLDTAEERGFYFDASKATWVVQFFALLRHSTGEFAGQPFVLSDWQIFIVGSLFGWKKIGTGYRRFSTAYIEICRKNGKTTLAGGIALLLLAFDDEPRAQIYCSATKKDQAKLLWNEAENMVRGTRGLASRIQCGKWALVHTASGSSFQYLGRDSKTLDGLNTHGNLVDEVHAHRARALWDVLITSTGSRRQPLTFAITTAGVYEPESLCWTLHRRAERVLDNVVQDDCYFAFLTGLDEGDDFRDPAVWPKANPNLGVSIYPNALQEAVERTKSEPSELNAVLRLHFNQWTQQEKRWIPMDAWRKCEGETGQLAGRRCYGGLDLASTSDLNALVLAFEPVEEGGMWDLLAHFWCPGDSVQKRVNRDLVPYDVWADQGFVTLTPGNVTDYTFIEHRVRELVKTYGIQELAYDPYNATEIVTNLMNDGIQMVEFRQGYLSMNAPAKAFERLVMSNKIRTGGNPVLAWMANNAVISRDPAGNIKPDKARAREKIDGVVAAIMAIGRAMVAPKPTRWAILSGNGVMSA